MRTLRGQRQQQHPRMRPTHRLGHHARTDTVVLDRPKGSWGPSSRRAQPTNVPAHSPEKARPNERRNWRHQLEPPPHRACTPIGYERPRMIPGGPPRESRSGTRPARRRRGRAWSGRGRPTARARGPSTWPMNSASATPTTSPNPREYTHRRFRSRRATRDTATRRGRAFRVRKQALRDPPTPAVSLRAARRLTI